MSASKPVKTDYVRARIDPLKRASFKRLAARHRATESKFLLALVDLALEEFEAKGAAQPAAPVVDLSAPDRMTVWLSSLLKENTKARAKSKNMSTSRFVSSLLRAHLERQTTFTDKELAVLRASNRELAAIGRNINQIARALNEAFYETERVKLDALADLKRKIEAHRERVDALIAASRNTWEAGDVAD